jgi:hypothetical protein
LRALELAFLLNEVRGAGGAEAGRVGRRFFNFAGMPRLDRFDHFRKLHLQASAPQGRFSRVASLQPIEESTLSSISYLQKPFRIRA